MKHYSTTVRATSLNVVGQSINQSYVLNGNVQPFYVNQCMSLRGGAGGEYPSGEGLEFLRGTEQPSR